VAVHALPDPGHVRACQGAVRVLSDPEKSLIGGQVAVHALPDPEQVKE
jgi:hypothetical protein